ncbi:methyltransferase domain-containing protein, partial [Arthrobacter sp. JCM 19049]|uniref:methyltransferase domain-containing protein n=1 Tax=Arthrobacter sp. JCM 19049 TaxID=1460643 RepID=UPI00243676A2
MLLASLARDSYRQALEVGCSIGELSAALAERSQRFLGLDASATAVTTARDRLAHLPHAQVREATVPQQWPTEQDGWDLVVISETGYFLAADELAELLTHCDRQMAPTGNWCSAIGCTRSRAGRWTGKWCTPWPGNCQAGIRWSNTANRTSCWRSTGVRVEPMNEPLRALAIVIPVHNEEEHLPACLAHLAAAMDRFTQCAPQVELHAVLVLDRCTDLSGQLVHDRARADAR